MSIDTLMLDFEIPTKKILNANNVGGMHHMKKSNIASYLREISSAKGVEIHTDKERATKRLELIKINADFIKKKSSLIKKLKKMKASDSEIEQAVNDLEVECKIDEFVDTKNVDFMFERFKVIAIIYPPTRRRLDPANLSLTLKPIIDGLTDSSWWEDDDFNHLVDTSFRYGGVSGIKNTYAIKIIVKKVDDNWSVMD